MEWPLAGAAVVFLGAYAWEVLTNAQGGAKEAAEFVIGAVWALFGVDYLVRLVLAPSRGRWFLHHLPDLAIIVLPILRPLRLLRLVTLVSIMQRSAGTALRGRITLYTAGSATLLIFTSALAALDAERHEPGSSIQSFGQALWWALTTITTVGYGDTFPASTQGRFIAALLMIGGWHSPASSQRPWPRGSSHWSRRRTPSRRLPRRRRWPPCSSRSASSVSALTGF